MIASAEFRAVTVGYGYRGPSRIAGCTSVGFAAAPGRVTFLGGTNGSGKSSFFRALLNSAPHISGFVEISRNEPAGSEPLQIAVQDLASRYDVSYLPQTPTDALPDGMTLSTANQLWERIHPVDAASDWEKLHEFFEQFKHKDKESISGGEAQIVALYFSVKRRADIYLLDEPSAFVSSTNRSVVAGAIRQLLGKERIVIVATHDDELLSEFQDQEKSIVTLS